MTAVKLTNPGHRAHNATMARMRWLAGAMGMLGSGLVGGCVTVKAPDAPIVIELNINIKQEVLYRLAPGAANAIDENEDIF